MVNYFDNNHVIVYGKSNGAFKFWIYSLRFDIEEKIESQEYNLDVSFDKPMIQSIWNPGKETAAFVFGAKNSIANNFNGALSFYVIEDPQNVWSITLHLIDHFGLGSTFLDSTVQFKYNHGHDSVLTTSKCIIHSLDRSTGDEHHLSLC